MNKLLLCALLLFSLGCAPVATNSAPAIYDPLALTQAAPAPIELVVSDAKRARELPIRVYLPATQAPAPVVLWSHGLGGTRGGASYLGEGWAARGFVAVMLQHPGSDDGAWKNAPLGGGMAALKQAGTLENFLLRVGDVPAVLDQLETWNRAPQSPLMGRLDMTKIGMSGHSFGAVTAQAVSGQKAARGRGFTDKRIKAAVVFSPSLPANADANRAFGSVAIPWLIFTGTLDASAIRETAADARLVVYPALPPGQKYQLILDKAEHSAFVDDAMKGDTQARNPNHHRALVAITTAFWDAYLRDDSAAKAWLDGDGAQSVLEAGDNWQKK